MMQANGIMAAARRVKVTREAARFCFFASTSSIFCGEKLLTT
jgi:biotin synthase-like enzyme